MDYKKLGVIGCGKMANALLSGAINNGFSAENIYLYDINSNSTDDLVKKYSFNTSKTVSELLNIVDVILIATKPFAINDVLNSIKSNYKNQLVMSILAGVKIQKYLSYIPNMKLIRIMPNTPALVNMGMSALCPCKNVSEKEIEYAYKFMKNCGEVILSSEDKIDIITSLSGSGPAFYYKIIELMAQAANKLGLEYEQALLLSAQTALGSAKMVIDNDFNINELIKNVTTPGGCTEVGNNILNNSDIDKILFKTINDTMQKAHDLG